MFGLCVNHRASERRVSVPAAPGVDRRRPFRQAGIPLYLGGDVSLFVRTDENGEAVIHAFAGRYSAGISRTVAARSRPSRDVPEIEVRPPAGEILVPLDLFWGE